MVTQPLEASRDVLGYTLKERVGSGGFGEVWSAVAPGGLLKALKIVYGFHDEKRAQAEMKALDRVKELRHPFLLSLERIEIFEGQLVVVTELADNSLADVFNQYIYCIRFSYVQSRTTAFNVMLLQIVTNALCAIV